MTHEGRLLRGEKNFKQNILLDNADTKYYLEHSKGKNLEEFEEKKEEKKKVKKTKSKKEKKE